MASVSWFRPTVTRYKTKIDKKTGKKIKIKRKVKTSKYWLAWRDPTTKKLVREKTDTRIEKLAKQLAREKEEKLFRIAKGWYDPVEDHINKTWNEAVELFLASSRARNRSRTTDDYEYSFSAFRKLIKPQLLRDITLIVIEDFVVQRSDEVNSPATVNKDLRHLRSFLRWAARLHYLAVVPDFSGVFLAVDASLPVRIPESDIDSVFEALRKPGLKLLQSAAWWRVYFQMALFLGARRGELFGLQWSRVSFQDGSILIHRETSKGRRDRLYEGAHALVALLKVWYGSFGLEPSPSDAVLPWSYPTYRQLYFDWDRIMKAAGIPKERRFIPHNCRSTCVSELLETESSFTVRDWVGHASVTTTEKYYANTKKARRVVAKKRKVRE